MPKGSNESALIMVRHGREGTVPPLRLAEKGVTITYPPPKGERQMLAQEPELIQRLPIVASLR